MLPFDVCELLPFSQLSTQAAGCNRLRNSAHLQSLFSPGSADCFGFYIYFSTREDPTQDLGGVQQPTLLHDCSNDDPSPKNMITVGCGCSLESQYVTPHGFRHGSIPSDGPVTASPVTSDSSRTRRIFHIPHWVSFHLIFCCILRSTGDWRRQS